MDNTISYRLNSIGWLLVNKIDVKSLVDILGFNQTEQIRWEEGLGKFTDLNMNESQLGKNQNIWQKGKQYSFIFF